MKLDFKSTNSTQFIQRVWSTLFLLLFLRQLYNIVTFFPTRIGNQANAINDFGITEWMINYEGGFVRRGLPGQLLYNLYLNFGVHPDKMSIMISVFNFLLLAIYLFYRSKNVLPLWALLSAPLFGFTVYMGDVFVRKDSFILLLFALFIHLISITRPIKIVSALLLSGIPVIAVLSHEISVLIYLPAAFLILILNVLSSSHKALRDSLIKFFCMIPAAVMAVWVAVEHGTLEQARMIKESWQQFFGDELSPDHLGGSIEWLQYSQDYGRKWVLINWHHQVFSCKYFSIEYGHAFVFMLISAIAFISLVIKKTDFKLTFLVVVLFQSLAMLPVYWAAIDYGRWLGLTILSALIITYEISPRSRELVSKMFAKPCFRSLRFTSFRATWLHNWILPIFFGFWGLPHARWLDWFSVSPFGSVLSLAGVHGPFRFMENLLQYI